MTRFILSPAAQADVDDIWNYTSERWGGGQAGSYIAAIRDACFDLVSGARPSRLVDARRGYRKLHVNAHVIYFRIAEDKSIAIIRILHQRMDAGKHL